MSKLGELNVQTGRENPARQVGGYTSSPGSQGMGSCAADKITMRTVQRSTDQH